MGRKKMITLFGIPILALAIVLMFQNCENNEFQTMRDFEFSYASSSVNPPLTVSKEWDGPQASIVFSNAMPRIVIDGESFTPSFLSVNPQAVNETNTEEKFLFQISKSLEIGSPIIDLMLANRSLPYLKYLKKLLDDRFGHKRIYLFLRFDSCIPENSRLDSMLFNNKNHEVIQPTPKSYCVDPYEGKLWTETPRYNSLSSNWISVQETALKVLVDHLIESGLSKRVIGFRQMYLEGGEWFLPPLAVVGSGATANADNMDNLGLFPWRSSDRDKFLVGDFRESESTMFREWLSQNNYPNVTFPNYEEQAFARLGSSFLVASPSDIKSVLYNQFRGELVATIQIRLAKKVKSLTGNKSLFSTFGGYLFSLAHFGGSTHTAVRKLIESPVIDIISAPYNYLKTREPNQAFIPHGPMDSIPAKQKLFTHEDDSRPFWAGDSVTKTSSVKEDISILLRNGLTTLIHNQGIYFFDLWNKGWYGISERTDDAQKTWTAIDRLNYVGQEMAASNSNLIRSEVVVFVDAKSLNFYPHLGIGEGTYDAIFDMYIGQITKLARLGFPVRYHLLSDLEDPQFDVSRFKVAFFINAYHLTAQQRVNIKAKLKNSGRTLVFLYAAGLYDEHNSPSIDAMNDLLETNSTSRLSMTSTENLASKSMTSFGESGGNYVLKPMFYGPLESSYGRYTAPFVNGETFGNIYHIDKGSYKIVYSNQGITNTDFLRALMNQAGVFTYSENAVVDGGKNFLVVHGNSTSTVIRVPQVLGAISLVNLAARGTDQVLCSNCSSVTLQLEGTQTVLLRLIEK